METDECEVSLQGYENVWKLDGGDGPTTLWIYENPVNCTVQRGECCGM